MMTLDPDSKDNGRIKNLLIHDISLIRFMSDIRNNDLRDLSDRLRSMNTEENAVLDDVYRSYLKGLNEKDRLEEESYAQLCVRLLLRSPTLVKAYIMYLEMPTGCSPINKDDVQMIIRSKNILQKISETPGCTAPLFEQIRILQEMCSQLLCIHSGRPMSNQRISDLIDRLEGSDSACCFDYGNCGLNEDDENAIYRLTDRMDDFCVVLISRAVSNSELGIPDGYNDLRTTGLEKPGPYVMSL